MKNLYDYLYEEIATPLNTVGMGNPGEGTEPLTTREKYKNKKIRRTSANFIYNGNNFSRKGKDH